jgi:hypothetical protein
VPLDSLGRCKAFTTKLPAGQEHMLSERCSPIRDFFHSKVEKEQRGEKY